ncbi:MAG: hypothetical protein C4318_08580 [Acidimicrobiia bacterium]
MIAQGCPECGQLPITMRSTPTATWYYCPGGHKYQVRTVLPVPSSDTDAVLAGETAGPQSTPPSATQSPPPPAQGNPGVSANARIVAVPPPTPQLYTLPIPGAAFPGLPATYLGRDVERALDRARKAKVWGIAGLVFAITLVFSVGALLATRTAAPALITFVLSLGALACGLVAFVMALDSRKTLMEIAVPAHILKEATTAMVIGAVDLTIFGVFVFIGILAALGG